VEEDEDDNGGFMLKLYHPCGRGYSEINFMRNESRWATIPQKSHDYQGLKGLREEHRRHQEEAPFRLVTIGEDRYAHKAVLGRGACLRTTPSLSTTASAESMHRVKHWLKSCQGNHKCDENIPEIVSTELSCPIRMLK
jgi:hypothetical protein